MLRRRAVFAGIFLLLAGGMGTPLSAGATTYYVAPGGSDSGPGTAASPWEHPAYGASRLQAGDTLILRSGTYVLADYSNDILRPSSGTASGWITIKGEDGGRAVLAGRDNLALAVELGGRSYIRLENLEITHDPVATGESVRFRDAVSIVDGPAAHIVLSNLFIHHVDEFGVDAADVDEFQILDCRIEYCGFGAVGGTAGTAGGLRNVVIRRSSLSWSGHYYQGGDGTDRPYDRPDGFGIEPSTGPILIEDTTSEHNYGDGLDSKADNTTIRRCIVANNSCDGVKLWGGGSRVENTLIYGRGDGNHEITPWAAIVIDTTEAGASFELVNVTVDDQLGGNYIMYVQYDEDVPVSLMIRNCIFRGTGPGCPIWLRDSVSLELDHNLFWLPSSDIVLIHGESTYNATQLASVGTANTSADPLFQAPAWGSAGDYHLQPGSPAIDAGTLTSAPAVDLDGRPRDAHPDLGAYEAPGGGGCVLSCSASVPQQAEAGQAVNFESEITTEGCSGEPVVLWDFGDGSTSTEVAPSHVYQSAGTFSWSLLASLEGVSCSASGTITVTANTAFSHTYVVPAVAHNPGMEGTSWRTDLALVNTGAATATVQLDFLGDDPDLSRTVDVPAGGTVVWRNVVEELFGVHPDVSRQGVVVLVSSEPLAVAARTFNQTAGGTFGQYVPALKRGDGLRAGTIGHLPLVAEGAGSRTNIGLVGLGDDEARVRIRLYGAGGEQLGNAITTTVAARSWLQINDVFVAAGAGPADAAYAAVELVGSRGEVWAYASVIDATTGDAITVPVIP